MSFGRKRNPTDSPGCPTAAFQCPTSRNSRIRSGLRQCRRGSLRAGSRRTLHCSATYAHRHACTGHRSQARLRRAGSCRHRPSTRALASHGELTSAALSSGYSGQGKKNGAIDEVIRQSHSSEKATGAASQTDWELKIEPLELLWPKPDASCQPSAVPGNDRDRLQCCRPIRFKTGTRLAPGNSRKQKSQQVLTC